MGKGSFIKILSLTIGLTIGLVLLARVRLELNYNSCVKDIDNVYKLSEYIVTKTQGEFNHGQTSGGTAPKLREYVPEIVECSRNTFFTAEAKLVTGGPINIGKHILGHKLFFIEPDALGFKSGAFFLFQKQLTHPM